jgi:hypothetical protein
MDPVNVRLLVTRQGNESVIETSVIEEQSISELNAVHFGDVPSSCTIKWIHCGHHLGERLPGSINSGSSFHVYIQERVQPGSEPIQHMGNEIIESTRQDKILLGFIHFVFVNVLAIFWNRFIKFPDQFDHISIFLLVAFSVITAISLWSFYT